MNGLMNYSLNYQVHNTVPPSQFYSFRADVLSNLTSASKEGNAQNTINIFFKPSNSGNSFYNSTAKNGATNGAFDGRTVTTRRLNRSRPRSAGWYAKLIFMCTIMTCTVIGNIFICWIISAKKPLRTIPNTFILNLALTNLMSSLINSPFFFIAIYYGSWPLGDTWCQVNGMTTSFFGLTSIMTLAGISLNRYCMILYPARYVTLFTTQSTRLMIIGIWVSAFLFALPPTIGWSKYLYVPGKAICTLIWNTDISYTFFCHTLGIYIPSTVIFYCYLKIFLTVRQSGKRITSHNAQNNVPQNGGESGQGDDKEKPNQRSTICGKVLTIDHFVISLARRLGWDGQKVNDFQVRLDRTDKLHDVSDRKRITQPRINNSTSASKSCTSSNTTTSKSQISSTSDKNGKNKKGMQTTATAKGTDEAMNIINIPGDKGPQTALNSLNNKTNAKNKFIEGDKNFQELVRLSSTSSGPSNSIHSTPGSSGSTSSSTHSSSFILPKRGTTARSKTRSHHENGHSVTRNAIGKNSFWATFSAWKRWDVGNKFSRQTLKAKTNKRDEIMKLHKNEDILKSANHRVWPWSTLDANVIPYIQAKHKSKLPLNCLNGCSPLKSGSDNKVSDLCESPYLLKNQISLSQYRSSWNGSPVMRDYGIAKNIKKFKENPLGALSESTSNIAIAINIPSDPEHSNKANVDGGLNLDDKSLQFITHIRSPGPHLFSENLATKFTDISPGYRSDASKLSHSCDNIVTCANLNPDINGDYAINNINRQRLYSVSKEGPSTTSSSYELYEMFRHTYNVFNPSAAFKRIHSCSILPDVNDGKSMSVSYLLRAKIQGQAQAKENKDEAFLKPTIINPFQLIPFAAHYGIHQNSDSILKSNRTTIKAHVARHRYCKQKLTTMRRKLSKKIFKSRRREDRVITQTILLIVVAFGFCWFPISMVNFLETFFKYHVPQWLDIFTVYLIFLNCALNPIIYGLMNKNFSNVLREIFSCFYPKSKQQRPIAGLAKPARKRSSRACALERQNYGAEPENEPPLSKVTLDKCSTLNNHNSAGALVGNGNLINKLNGGDNVAGQEKDNGVESATRNILNGCIASNDGPALKSCFKSQLIDLTTHSKGQVQPSLKVSTCNNVNFQPHNHIHVY